MISVRLCPRRSLSHDSRPDTVILSIFHRYTYTIQNSSQILMSSIWNTVQVFFGPHFEPPNAVWVSGMKNAPEGVFIIQVLFFVVCGNWKHFLLQLHAKAFRSPICRLTVLRITKIYAHNRWRCARRGRGRRCDDQRQSNSTFETLH